MIFILAKLLCKQLVNVFCAVARAFFLDPGTVIG